MIRKTALGQGQLWVASTGWLGSRNSPFEVVDPFRPRADLLMAAEGWFGDVGIDV